MSPLFASNCVTSIKWVSSSFPPEGEPRDPVLIKTAVECYLQSHCIMEIRKSLSWFPKTNCWYLRQFIGSFPSCSSHFSANACSTGISFLNQSTVLSPIVKMKESCNLGDPALERMLSDHDDYRCF